MLSSTHRPARLLSLICSLLLLSTPCTTPAGMAIKCH
jgi:hypothetical protein